MPLDQDFFGREARLVPRCSKDVGPKLSPLTATNFQNLHFLEKDAERNSEQFPGSGALRFFLMPNREKNVDCQTWKLLTTSGRVKDAQVPRIPSTWRIW